MSNIFSNFTTTATKVQQPKETQQVTQPIAVKEVIAENSPKADTVELSSNNKQTRKGPIKAVKGFIAGVKKFFSTVGEYTKGLFKGIAGGFVAGSVVYAGGSAVNGIRQFLADRAGKKVAQEAGEEFIQKAVKKFPAKVAAGIVAAGALAASLWNASLNATQKQSEIDMRWTGIETKK